MVNNKYKWAFIFKQIHLPRFPLPPCFRKVQPSLVIGENDPKSQEKWPRLCLQWCLLNFQEVKKKSSQLSTGATTRPGATSTRISAGSRPPGHGRLTTSTSPYPQAQIECLTTTITSNFGYWRVASWGLLFHVQKVFVVSDGSLALF